MPNRTEWLPESQGLAARIARNGASRRAIDNQNLRFGAPFPAIRRTNTCDSADQNMGFGEVAEA